jgi:hypothetical protein
MAGFFGKRAKLMIGTASPPTVGLNYVSDGLKRHRSVADLMGLGGTFSHFAARCRPSLQPVAGPLVLYPTPVELVTLLPLMLQGTPVGNSYPLADPVQLTTFNYWKLLASKIHKFAGVAIAAWTLRARQGEAVTLSCDLIGQTLDPTALANTFPAYSFDQTTKPFMFHELILTVGGVAYQCKEFALSLDWAVDAGRFFNSQTLQGVYPTDRIITLSHDNPFGDAEALYGTDQDAGVSASAVFTSGGTSLSLSMPAVQYEDDSPTVPGRDEVMLPLTGVCRVASGGAALSELAVVLDSSP